MNNNYKKQTSSRAIFFRSMLWTAICIALVLIGFFGAAYFTGFIK